jgi:hypothetical protein
MSTHAASIRDGSVVSRRVRRGLALAALACAAAYGVSREANAQLNITFAQSGSMPAEMVTGFQTAGQILSQSFSNPTTINITISAAALGSGIIGSAGSATQNFSYTSVRNALTAAATSADDFGTTSNLQTGSSFGLLINRTTENPAGSGSLTPYFDNNGSTNNTTISVNRATARVLGLNNTVVSDASITFSTNFAFDFNPRDGIDADKIDFIGVAIHEIGHALGFRSGVDSLDTGGVTSENNRLLTLWDLYRYSADSIAAGADVPDFTADNRANPKYFSINGGVNSIASFSNGQSNGDGRQASHWKDNLGIGIMDPTSGFGELQTISENDRRAFDVMGFTRDQTWEWRFADGGSFNTAINWNSYGVPDVAQDAVFELSAVYTGNVTVNVNRTVRDLIVRQGTLTLAPNAGNRVVTAGRDFLVGTTVAATASLTFTTGILNSTNTAIGGTSASSNATFTFTGATWNNSTNVFVGGTASGAGGTGLLNLSSTGTVAVTGTLRVYGPGVVNQNSGRLNAGIVNIDSNGDLNVTGGQMTVTTQTINSGTLAFTGGTVNLAVATNNASGTITSANTTVTATSLFSTGRFSFDSGSAALGVVTNSGSGTSSATFSVTSMNNAGQLLLTGGTAGLGTTSGIGSITASGSTAVTASSLRQNALLFSGTATLTTSGTQSVSSTTAQATADFSGSSTWSHTGSLNVGTDGSTTGRGRLFVSGNALVDVTGTLTVASGSSPNVGGTVSLTGGTLQVGALALVGPSPAGRLLWTGGALRVVNSDLLVSTASPSFLSPLVVPTGGSLLVTDTAGGSVTGNLTVASVGSLSSSGSVVALSLANQGTSTFTGGTASFQSLSNQGGLSVTGGASLNSAASTNFLGLSVTGASASLGVFTNTGTGVLTTGAGAAFTATSMRNQGQATLGGTSADTGLLSNTGTATVTAASFSATPTTNSGTLTFSATVSTATLGALTNTGQLTSDATSLVAGPTTNSGRVLVSAGSTALGATQNLAGGTITSTGALTATSLVNDGLVSLSGSVVALSLTNNGTTSFTGGTASFQSITNQGGLSVSGGASLTSPSTINLLGLSVTGASASLGVFTNSGTGVLTTGAGATLTSTSLLNQGQATLGGTSVDTGLLSNTGTATVTAASFSAAPTTNSGTLTFSATVSTATLGALTNSGQLTSDAASLIAGPTTNSGRVLVNAGSTALGATQNLAGGTITSTGALTATSLVNDGVVSLTAGTASLGAVSGAGTLTVDGTAVAGAGDLAQLSLLVQGSGRLNSAGVAAVSSTGTPATAQVGGSGTWTHTGGLTAGFNAVTGSGQVSVLAGALLDVSGTLSAAAGAGPQTGGTVALTGGTIRTGALDLAGDPARLVWTTGTLEINDSTFALAPAGVLGASRTLTPGQQLRVTDAPGGAVTGLISVAPGATMTVAGGSLTAILYSNPGSLEVTSGSVAVPGQLGNGGTVAVTGGTVTVGLLGAFGLQTNLLRVSGGTLSSTSTTNVIFSAGTLSQSDITVSGTGTVRLGGANVSTLASQVLLDGPTALFESAVGTSALASLATINSSGRLTVRNGQTFGVNSPLSLAGGALTVTQIPLAGTSSVSVTAGGSVTTARVDLAGLSIAGAGSSANLLTGISDAASVLGALAVTAGGVLDVGDNDLVLRSGTVAAIAASLQSGGIISTLAGTGGPTSRNNYAAVGLLQNAEPTFGTPLFPLFGGIAVGTTDLLLKFTYLGDTNLDGTLDTADFNAVLNGFTNSLSGWANGDANYDGVVNGTDWSLFSSAYSFVLGGGLPFDGGTGNGGMIPEPAALGLLALPMLALGRRRR